MLQVSREEREDLERARSILTLTLSFGRGYEALASGLGEVGEGLCAIDNPQPFARCD
jgi:hypothetical protein